MAASHGTWNRARLAQLSQRLHKITVSSLAESHEPWIIPLIPIPDIKGGQEKDFADLTNLMVRMFGLESESTEITNRRIFGFRCAGCEQHATCSVAAGGRISVTDGDAWPTWPGKHWELGEREHAQLASLCPNGNLLHWRGVTESL